MFCGLSLFIHTSSWLVLLCYYVSYSVEGGELFDRVVSVGKFSEDIAKVLFYQILAAVKVLGAMQYVVCLFLLLLVSTR